MVTTVTRIAGIKPTTLGFSKMITVRGTGEKTAVIR
jgi:hypothetical protein